MSKTRREQHKIVNAIESAFRSLCFMDNKHQRRWRQVKKAEDERIKLK